MQKLAVVQKAYNQQLGNLVTSFRKKTQEITKSWYGCTQIVYTASGQIPLAIF